MSTLTPAQTLGNPSRKGPRLLSMFSFNSQNSTSLPEKAAMKKPPSRRFSLGRRHKSSLPKENSSGRVSAQTDDLNVVQWLEACCPQDVLPKVLAFAGPQKAAALKKVNRHWREIMKQEATWKVLCEELYKWKPGDKEPKSWADHYRLSPCVPMDWPSIAKALQLATGDRVSRRNRRSSSGKRPQIRSLRVLLRPGTYYLTDGIKVDSTSSVSFETIQLPKNTFQPSYRAPHRVHKEIPEGPVPSRPSVRSLRSLMDCRRSSSVEETEPTDFSDYEEDWQTDSMAEFHRAPPTRANLVLRSRKSNEPAFRVRRGTLNLKNVTIHHHSEGLDIWNGNAAIQIQPVFEENDPVIIPAGLLPAVSLDSVHITSYSGRGIVCIDGGKLRMRGSAVEDCAATGIYIGGPGSQVDIHSCDVVNNGVGNSHRRIGIARGHSGIYLEQGKARIIDCNISTNTLTGISAVSPSNAFLTLEDSDLMNNGTNQVELPSRGTVARERSVIVRNSMSIVGRGRSRSGLLVAGLNRVSYGG